jgi:hypothetical protein
MFRIIVRNKHTLVYIRPLGKNIGKIFNTWKFDVYLKLKFKQKKLEVNQLF